MRHVTDIFWSGVAMALSFMPSRFLIRLLLKISEPYQHIESADGSETYMGRWWLLNPYEKETYKPRYRWLPWNIRLHHIMREDLDRYLHSHPWNARRHKTAELRRVPPHRACITRGRLDDLYHWAQSRGLEFHG